MKRIIIVLITLILASCNSPQDDRQQHQEADSIVRGCVISVEAGENQGILALLLTTDQQHETYRVDNSEVWAFMEKHADPQIDECSSELAYAFVYNKFLNALIRVGDK